MAMKTMIKKNDKVIVLADYLKRKNQVEHNYTPQDALIDWLKKQQTLIDQVQKPKQKAANQQAQTLPVAVDTTKDLPNQIVDAICQLAEVAKAYGKLKDVILLNLTDLRLQMMKTTGKVEQTILYYVTNKPALRFTYDQKATITLDVIDPLNSQKVIGSAICTLENTNGANITGKQLIKTMQTVAFNNAVCIIAK